MRIFCVGRIAEKSDGLAVGQDQLAGCRICNEYGSRHLLDDGAQALLRTQDRLFTVSQLGDVEERDNDPSNPVVRGAIGQHTTHIGSPAGLDFGFQGHQLFEHGAGIGQEVATDELLREVIDRPVDVTRYEVEEVPYGRREATNAQFRVQEHDGDIRTAQKIGQIVRGGFELFDLGLELRIDRTHFLVQRLQFLLACFQFFGSRAELFVHRLQLFVRGLQLFVARFEFLNRALQLRTHRVQLGRELVPGVRLGARGRGCSVQVARRRGGRRLGVLRETHHEVVVIVKVPQR